MAIKGQKYVPGSVLPAAYIKLNFIGTHPEDANLALIYGEVFPCEQMRVDNRSSTETFVFDFPPQDFNNVLAEAYQWFKQMNPQSTWSDC